MLQAQGPSWMTYQGKEAGRSIKVLVGIRISTEVIVVQMFCSRGAERTNIQFHWWHCLRCRQTHVWWSCSEYMKSGALSSNITVVLQLLQDHCPQRPQPHGPCQLPWHHARWMKHVDSRGKHDSQSWCWPSMHGCETIAQGKTLHTNEFWVRWNLTFVFWEPQRKKGWLTVERLALSVVVATNTMTVSLNNSKFKNN